MKIILASTSPIRRRLLAAAGVEFRIQNPAVNETELKAAAGDIHPAALAETLAIAKARSCISSAKDLVIGADQVLSLEGKIFTKPSKLAEARQQLVSLRGKTHHLYSAVACTRDDGVCWSFTAEAKLAVRNFSDTFLEWYLARAGNDILDAVGSYKIEEHGSQLFDTVDGDYFTVLGLPLLPLLNQLRSWGAIPV